MKKLTMRTKLLIAIITTLFLLGFANLALTSGRKVEVFTTTVESASGHDISVRVYKPKTATKEKPAPAVAFMHGLSTTKEAYTQYAIELSRRGYVVATPDMMNHGDSELADIETFFGDPNSEGTGLYTATRLLASYDYVDSSNIGVAGHSMGGNAVNSSVFLDNFSPQPLISSAYLLSSDVMLNDFEGNPMNIYGDRSVGLFYSTYDHVYFKGTDEAGAPLGAVDYLDSMEAKTFLSFSDLENILPTIEKDKDYTQNGAIRRINQKDVIHPYAQGGNAAISYMVDFFEDTLGAPKEVAASKIVADRYQLLSLASLFSMLAVGYYLLNVLLETKFFNSLKAKTPNIMPTEDDKKMSLVRFGLLLLNVAFAFVSVTLIFKNGLGYFVLPILPQQVSNIFAIWSLVNGLFMILTMLLSYFFFAKKRGYTLADWNVKIGFKSLFKSIALALVTFAGMISFTYLAGKVFQMDMRMYLWGIRYLPFDKLYLLLIYAPFFIIFGIAVSLTINGTSFVKFKNEPSWLNTLIIAFFNMVPPLLITVIGFAMFKQTGIQPNIFGSDYTFTYMINAIPAYPVAIIYMRILNKHVNNPYVAGIIGGLLFAFFQVASVFTMHTFMFM